ncbi:MAG: GMC family oxidoreductase [Verrucomicrobiae bacterium]|nr:GMC family oxidoreductase [Verrucomicrobiae bacterium]MDW8308323.1 GMC family oxidoreductase [Verrucomicrobiales bacterium]
MTGPWQWWLHDVTSALAYSAARPHETSPERQRPHNDLTQFLLSQQARLPDWLRAPMKALIAGFDLAGVLRSGRLFHHLPPEQRERLLAGWRNGRFAFQREFIRYCESLALMALYSRGGEATPEEPGYGAEVLRRAARELEAASELRVDVLVIGSGPGGALTACLLAEAGRDVLLLEEGPCLPLDSCPPFSLAELARKYRNGGQTVALGRTNIAYAEGCCVGGGSEINSGLYHRTPPEILERWQRDFQVEAVGERDLRPHFEAVERDLCVSRAPGKPPAAALKLREGATRLGWASVEVPRWVRFESASDGSAAPGRRQSMTETFVPRFLRAGGRLLAEARALRLRADGSRWMVEAARRDGRRVRVLAGHVFVCAGAVQTPVLLRRSGIRHHVGNSLQVHPTAKLIARFAEEVNTPGMGVPPEQVRQFAPRLGLGCSISSPPFLALGLSDHGPRAPEVLQSWRRCAVYYAMIRGEGRGQVRPLPGFRDPLVRYELTEADRRALVEGLRRLAQTLFAAGATELFPSLSGGPIWRCEADLAQLPEALDHGVARLMTIHLFGSCPMGEARARCATDSFGRVRGLNNLRVNDASLLPGAPGVNPQGTILAVARRNALHFLGKLG